MNPYEPPQRSDSTAPQQDSRSIGLLLLASGLGIACMSLAMLITVETLQIRVREGYWNPELTKGMTAATTILVFGACWGSAAVLYWIRKTKTATTINLGTAAFVFIFLTLAKLGVIL